MNIYKPPKQKSLSFSKKLPIPIKSYIINLKSSSKKSKIDYLKTKTINNENRIKTPYKRKIVFSSNNSRDFSPTLNNTTINSTNRYSEINTNNNINNFTVNNNNSESHRCFITNISQFNFEDDENEKKNNFNFNYYNNVTKTNKLKRNKVKKISFINIDNYLKDIDDNNNNINNNYNNINNNNLDINNFTSNNPDKYICENNKTCDKCFLF